MAGPELLLAAAAVQAVGSISAGNNQAMNYKAQAAALDYNAKIQRDNAARVSLEYSIREDQQRRQQQQVIGRQRAGIAESGIGFSGTALDLEDQSLINAEMDNLSLRYEGNTQRVALLQDAEVSTYQAGIMKANAKAAKIAGYTGALGSVLGGAGRYSSSTAAINQSATPTAPAGTLPWQTKGNVKPAWMGGGYY